MTYTFRVSEYLPLPLVKGRNTSQAVTTPLFRSALPYLEKQHQYLSWHRTLSPPPEGGVVVAGYKLLKCGLNKQNITQLFQRQVS